uniref:Integrase catalytic domain-containing protein n=1 Tax=Chromera velia CCMP2878 TaxID=1169474 RepID=A0A0G4EZ84_9ALVE|eukprot:Cvel_14315.t1-p1 / transcript=Cvel_14315.t1 / gene=Cvel_14315 / organism=Chromera_velia_CCMP2878 / gene_product=Retrotransposable element Tf2 155 kDa protein type, putative / transcript_product=Retrotransposable element Tf2 155 kDa protein type, putative / location=Cvel_scaffold1012:33241-35170(-) / protein_length=429 / sequence_SO=supercontig / SO=protein_coding / is_pseudo=false
MQGLTEFAQPTDYTSLHQFLGLANWFRRFIPRFSFLAGPLTFLLQGNVPFEWKTAQSRAFVELKKAVQEHATLALPDPSKPVILVPDVSQSAGAIGAVALQKDCVTGRYRPLAFGSRRLTSTEAKYPVRELEFLAIVHFVKRLPVRPRPLSEAVPVSVQPVGSLGAEYTGLPDLVPEIEESQTSVREGDGRQSQPLPIPLRPWESTCIDRLTDLPPSGDKGFDAILLVLCRLIKAVVLIPTHNTAGAEKTARIYRQHVSYKKGFQRYIVCDRVSRFLACFWQTLHASSGSEVDFATTSHHDTAGTIERMNHTLEEALRCLVDMKHSGWSEFLCDVEFAYNSSVYEGTGFVPLTLDGGKSPLIPPALNLPVSVEPSFDAGEFLEKHSQMIAAVRDLLRSAQQVMTRNANRRRRPAKNIRVGDYVLVYRTW